MRPGLRGGDSGRATDYADCTDLDFVVNFLLSYGDS